MCYRVGAPYDNMSFQEPEWYSKYSWTEEEQEDFKEWLKKKILSDSTVRKEITNFIERPSAYKAEKVATMFLFNYGWKLR